MPCLVSNQRSQFGHLYHAGSMVEPVQMDAPITEVIDRLEAGLRDAARVVMRELMLSKASDLVRPTAATASTMDEVLTDWTPVDGVTKGQARMMKARLTDAANAMLSERSSGIASATQSVPLLRAPSPGVVAALLVTCFLSVLRCVMRRPALLGSYLVTAKRMTNVQYIAVLDATGGASLPTSHTATPSRAAVTSASPPALSAGAEPSGSMERPQQVKFDEADQVRTRLRVTSTTAAACCSSRRRCVQCCVFLGLCDKALLPGRFLLDGIVGDDEDLNQVMRSARGTRRKVHGSCSAASAAGTAPESGSVNDGSVAMPGVDDPQHAPEKVANPKAKLKK
jgi:hypothetical protein